MTRPVSSLLAELTGARLVAGDASAQVSGLEHDSRLAQTGTLFVAIPGFRVDGHEFLGEVAGKGAAALLVQNDRLDSLPALPGAAVIAVDDTRIALAEAAAWYYRHPGREMGVIGITGTDGKTTTTYLLTSILEMAGLTVGRLGTVDVHIAGSTGANLTRMSTPEANEVQRLLRTMADASCDYALVESTSHGLALHRLDLVEYDVAVMTNVTGDHLDFHQTFEAYREAKGLLFEALDIATDKGIPKSAVVNADDPSWNYMLSRTEADQLAYGLESKSAEVVARNIRLQPSGSEFRLITPAGMVETSVRIPALFNVANALAAASAALTIGVDVNTIGAGLSSCPGVPGRMERIDEGQPFEVIVDYAHTGDSVRKVLEVLREVTSGELIVVVGAAGERDPGRRFGVGRAAAEGANFAVFTNEDPRTEDPGAIVREIGAHAEGAGRVRGQDFVEIEDRGEAIDMAMRRAKPGDLVLVCGKGHEQSIIYGTEARPWDDREVARESLARLGFRKSR